ncbi:MAG: FAD-dependent thymidylate synthase [Patescibacteria group bacterium]
MQVKLLSKPDTNLLTLMSKAARTCYEATEPVDDKTIDIENRIFKVGHHTVIQHLYFTFFIEGVPIGSITLGLHLNMNFNVSSQRSGRFCFGMFSDPDAIKDIMAFVQEFYPETTDDQRFRIEHYINLCQTTFKDNIDRATIIAADFIRKERPEANDQYIGQNAKKFAQEQLRMVIPVIFPTAVAFTINLSTLAALYRVSWDPVMVHLTEEMAQRILSIEPSLDYMFQRQPTPATISQPKPMESNRTWHVNYPACEIQSVSDLRHVVYPEFGDLHPIDTLYYNPKFMPNNNLTIKTWVMISLATMGQDQRHRRINRGPVQWTGLFYCPPILREMDLTHQIYSIYRIWSDLTSGLHPALAQTLAPYGTMVEYTKSGDVNAILHEQEKRLCWCTQQEIYGISSQLRNKIADEPNCTDEFLAHLAPPCFQSGKCGEGVRYCGRDLKIDCDRFFPLQRKV